MFLKQELAVVFVCVGWQFSIYAGKKKMCYSCLKISIRSCQATVKELWCQTQNPFFSLGCKRISKRASFSLHAHFVSVGGTAQEWNEKSGSRANAVMQLLQHTDELSLDSVNVKVSRNPDLCEIGIAASSEWMKALKMEIITISASVGIATSKYLWRFFSLPPQSSGICAVLKFHMQM